MKKLMISIAACGLALIALPATAAQENVQEVTVEISGMTYMPAEVAVESGVPVKMTFTRDDEPTCGGTILFPELEIRREVAAGESVTIEFTPEKSGDLNFTCGMKMMKGKIVVR
ncbi:MAG: cupredoxin domain-containing protein [Thermoanaerobaculia bacterium]|nr:cupredoxin domain-containing protein [Thermoanaerobaculia bacterium]